MADGTIKTEEITITCGIFQGNTFSPLIFCMALFPLYHILNRAQLGFFLPKQRIFHLKLYAQNEEELKHALQIAEDFSNDINMTFGLDKCAILLITNGKYATTNICPETLKLDDEENKGYKYLGIMEGVDFHMNKVKEFTKKEYVSRVRKIFWADMNGDYMMTAVCAYTIPVLCYTFGIIKWTKGELRRLDVKTGKMLTMHGIHHPKGSVYQLYLHQNKGGRGLTRVEDTHNCECVVLAKHVLSSTDTLTKMICTTKTPTQKFLLKFASSPKFTTPELMVEHHHQGLKEKPLHGKFFKQQEEIPQVDLEKLHQWLRQARLQPETKAAICAAQEQTIATNFVSKKILKMNVNPLCRLCCKVNETMSHIVSGCKQLAGTKYTKQHDKIFQYPHWCIIQDNSVPVNLNWQWHIPKPAMLIAYHLLVT
eukprot:15365955-Ditylum_brightwellii.AAC.1